ncbi:MAG: O-antigen ligase family protein [Elusimicrobiota bacterium]
MAAALLLAFGAVEFAARGAGPLLHPAGPVLAAFAALSLLSALRSPCPYPSFLSLAKLWAVVCFGWIAAARWGRLHRRLFRGFVIGMGIVQSVLLFAARVAEESPRLLIPGNPQYMGLWLCAGTLVAAGSALAARTAGARRWLLAAAFLQAAAVLQLSSRTAAAALAAGLFVLAVDRFRARGAAAFALAAGLAFAAVPASVWETRLEFHDPLAFKRLDIWQTALAGIADKPWLGWGPGRFDALYDAHALPQEETAVRYGFSTRFAHNDYLQAAADVGVPGALILIAGLGLCFAAFKPLDGAEKGQRAALVSAAVFALFNFPMVAPALGLLAAGLLSGEKRPPARRSFFRARRAAGIGLGIFFAALAAGSALDAAARFSRSRGEQGMARRLMPWDAEPLLERAEVLTHPAAGPENPGRARDLLAEALRVCPGRAQTWRDLAHLYFSHRSSPDLPAAEAALREAVERHPTQALWRLELSEVLMKAGNLEGASEAAREALRLEPNYAAAALQAGTLLRLRGEPARAERWLEGFLSRRRAADGRRELWPYAKAVLRLDEKAFQEELARCRRSR